MLVHRRAKAAQLLGDRRVRVGPLIDGDENHSFHGQDLHVAGDAGPVPHLRPGGRVK
jgi:hypothetical protein